MYQAQCLSKTKQPHPLDGFYRIRYQDKQERKFVPVSSIIFISLQLSKCFKLYILMAMTGNILLTMINSIDR